MSEEKGFLSRWSDRKLKVEEAAELQSAIEKAAPEETSDDEFEGKTDDEIISILELPEPETLKLGDTVEKFMDGRVPERIRARALRAFWKTNPVLANIDGLDEYCEDYTDAVMVIENLQTVYEVGKGYASQALDALEALADDESSEATQPAVASVDATIASNESIAEQEVITGEARSGMVPTSADQHNGEVATGTADQLHLEHEEANSAPLRRPARMQFR